MRGAAEIGGRGACILLVTFATAAAFSLGRPVGSSPATYRLCGNKLADLLSLICKDRGYYDPFAPKPAHARGEARRENRVGVSDECCRIGCTEANLKRYCASSEDDYGDPDLPRDEQPSAVSSRRPEQIPEGDASARVPSATKVSRGGKIRKGGGGGGGRKKGGARLPRGGGKGKRCRCRRRRRKFQALCPDIPDTNRLSRKCGKSVQQTDYYPVVV